MMRTAAAPLMLSLLALTTATACSGDHLTDTVITPAESRAATPARPAGGSCAVQFQWLQNDPTRNPVPLATLALNGSCTLKHLGATTMSATQWIYAYPNFENVTTYTAANGDQLMTRFVGVTTSAPDQPLDLTFEGTETIVGGTGRFAGATGTAWLIGSAAILTGQGQYTTSGTMRY